MWIVIQYLPYLTHCLLMRELSYNNAVKIRTSLVSCRNHPVHAILIYCCSAQNDRESCQLAHAKQWSKMVNNSRKTSRWAIFIIFPVMSHLLVGKDTVNYSAGLSYRATIWQRCLKTCLKATSVLTKIFFISFDGWIQKHLWPLNLNQTLWESHCWHYSR